MGMGHDDWTENLSSEGERQTEPDDYREDVVSFDDCIRVRSTPKAIVVLIDGEEHLIPDSQIHPDSEVWKGDDGSRGKLMITRWIAEKKELVQE